VTTLLAELFERPGARMTLLRLLTHVGLAVAFMSCICRVNCEDNATSALVSALPGSCQHCAGTAGQVPFGEGKAYCGRTFLQCVCCRASLEQERRTVCARPEFSKHNTTKDGKSVDCVETIKAGIEDEKKNCGAAAALIQAKARRVSSTLRRSSEVAPSATRLAWDAKLSAMLAADRAQQRINALAGDPTAPPAKKGVGPFKDECEPKEPHQELLVKSCAKLPDLCGHPNGCNTQLWLEEMRHQRVDNWYRMYEGFPCA